MCVSWFFINSVDSLKMLFRRFLIFNSSFCYLQIQSKEEKGGKGKERKEKTREKGEKKRKKEKFKLDGWFHEQIVSCLHNLKLLLLQLCVRDWGQSGLVLVKGRFLLFDDIKLGSHQADDFRLLEDKGEEEEKKKRKKEGKRSELECKKIGKRKGSGEKGKREKKGKGKIYNITGAGLHIGPELE